jgi:hypothetical protein
MAVPNTNTFSLADVIAAVNPNIDSLQECFNQAASTAFDSTYDTPSVDELDDFRNYGNSSVKSQINIANNNYNSSNACGQTQNFSVFKSGVPRQWANGDIVYDDNSGSAGSPFSGNSAPSTVWYSAGQNVNQRRFQINNFGTVYNLTNCNTSLSLPNVYYVKTGGDFNGSVASGDFIGQQTLYYDSSIGDASNLKPSDILYTNSALTTTLGANTGAFTQFYYQMQNTNVSTTYCVGEAGGFFAINTTSGVILRANCRLL